MSQPTVTTHKEAVEIYNAVKTRFLEVAEELKMRRENDLDYEKKVNKLITEKFEIKTAKEEEIGQLKKTIEDLKQEIIQRQKEFEEKMKMHEEDKAVQNISINSSSKGIKALKDEILELQLAKYGLEKKIKDQEHQLQMEGRSRNEQQQQIIQLEKAGQSFQVQCEKINSRLEYLASLVVKTEHMHRKLIQANEHNNCLLTHHKTMVENVQLQLTEAKAELAASTSVTNENGEEKMIHKHTEDNEQYKKMMCLQKQTEEEGDRLRSKNQFLLNSLSESNQLVSTLQSKLASINQLNDGLQFELDESKMAAADCKEEIARKISTLLNIKKEMEALKEQHLCEVSKAKCLEEELQRLQENTSEYEATVSSLNNQLLKANDGIKQLKEEPILTSNVMTQTDLVEDEVTSMNSNLVEDEVTSMNSNLIEDQDANSCPLFSSNNSNQQSTERQTQSQISLAAFNKMKSSNTSSSLLSNNFTFSQKNSRHCSVDLNRSMIEAVDAVPPSPTQNQNISSSSQSEFANLTETCNETELRCNLENLTKGVEASPPRKLPEVGEHSTSISSPFGKQSTNKFVVQDEEACPKMSTISNVNWPTPEKTVNYERQNERDTSLKVDQSFQPVVLIDRFPQREEKQSIVNEEE